jgi:hypothetical protein
MENAMARVGGGMPQGFGRPVASRCGDSLADTARGDRGAVIFPPSWHVSIAWSSGNQRRVLAAP